MNWLDSVLFHTKSNGGSISRRSIEGLLSQGLNSYDDSIKRLKSLVSDDYIQRASEENHSWELTKKGDQYITPYFESVKELMDLVRPQVRKAVGDISDIEVKGGITGIYFTYTKMSMFRFHPYRSKGETFLFVRLPNLIGEAIEHKSNEIYLSREVLEHTTFLRDIIFAHLDMVDKYYKQEM